MAPEAGISRRRLGAGVGLLAVVAALVVVDLSRLPAPLPATVPPPAYEETGVIRDAREALAAWARFATSGQLDTLLPYFAVGGPQHHQLTAEAENIKASPSPYRFDLAAAAVLLPVSPTVRVVRATVVVQRGDEVDRYRWDLEMQRPAGASHWRLWTVRQQPGEPQGGVGGSRSTSPG